MYCGHHLRIIALYLINHHKPTSNKNMNNPTTTPQNAIYLRVSTKQQGESGLGIEGQRFAIKHAGLSGTEFVEIESGKSTKRPQLAAAMAHCRASGGSLIVAKLDRLARNVQFCFELKNSGVAIRALDVPEFNTLTVGIFATVAQHEAERISERTRAALAARCARTGVVHGARNLNPERRAMGTAARIEAARENANNRRAASYASTLRLMGWSYGKIADHLNSSGFESSTGKSFAPTTVRRVLLMA
jgi:DNA invertase Pin-like site-specific DNA recombinase